MKYKNHLDELNFSVVQNISVHNLENTQALLKNSNMDDYYSDSFSPAATQNFSVDSAGGQKLSAGNNITQPLNQADAIVSAAKFTAGNKSFAASMSFDLSSNNLTGADKVESHQYAQNFNPNISVSSSAALKSEAANITVNIEYNNAQNVQQPSVEGFAANPAVLKASQTVIKENSVPTGAAYYDTSVFMAGSCYIKVVLFESNGKIDRNTEDWSQYRINEVKAQISLGVQWWEDMWDKQGYIGDLNFTIDFTTADNPFSTSYEAINHTSSEDYLWINEFLRSEGYTATTEAEKHEANYRYNNDLRIKNNTDWAFTIYVADSFNDADNMFTDNYFGYAYLNGPYMHMTYGNDGWGIENMQMVTAHEIGHIFGALDEYPGSVPYDARSGYYNTLNSNAYDGNKTPQFRQISIMAESEMQKEAYQKHISSNPSLEMIGWKDNNYDKIIDVLGEPIRSSNVNTTYNEKDQEINLKGIFNIVPLKRSSPGNSMTINTIDFLQYRFSGEWINYNAQAWNASSYDINVTIKLTAISNVFEWRVVDADDTGKSQTFKMLLPDKDLNNLVIGIGGQYMSLYVIPQKASQNNTIVSSGTIDVEGIISGTKINQQDSKLNILNGGVSYDTVISEYGSEIIFSNGTANNTIINREGVQQIASMGTAIGTVINSGGRQQVDSGATVTDTVIKSGGIMNIFRGAKMLGKTVVGGSMFISDAKINLQQNEITFDATVRTTQDNYIINNIDFIYNCVFSIMISDQMGAGDYKLALGAEKFKQNISVFKDNSNTSAGFLSVNDSSKTFGSNKYILLQSNGALVLRVTAALISNDTVVKLYSVDEIISGGSLMNAKTLAVNGTDYMFITSRGVANNTVINSGGSQYLSQGGLANNTTINKGGVQNVYTGAVVNSTTINAEGTQNILNSGIASNTTVNYDAKQYVLLGGNAKDTVLYGGKQFVENGGTANGTLIESNSFQLLGSSSIATDTVINLGYQYICADAVANNTQINNKSFQYVSSGGTANQTVVNNGGSQTVLQGGSANDTVINFGHQYINSGAKAKNIQLNSGGTLNVYAGAQITGAIILGGEMNTFGDIYAQNSNIVFDIHERTTSDSIIIDNINNLRNVEYFAVNLSDVQAAGSYKLAGNAGNFSQIISLYCNQEMFGSLTLNNTMEYFDKLYTITVDAENILSLNIQDPNNIKKMVKNDLNANGYAEILFQKTSGDGAGYLGTWLDGSNTWQGLPQAALDEWDIHGSFDFTGDGYADIMFRNKQTGAVGIWGQGDYQQWKTIGHGVGQEWETAAVGDIDGNGVADIIWYNNQTQGVGAWLNGTTEFRSIAGKMDAQEWKIVGCNDTDGNGKADIIFQNRNSGYIGAWLDGNADNFQTLGSYGAEWQIAAIGDVDGNGVSDLLMWNNQTNAMGLAMDAMKEFKFIANISPDEWEFPGMSDYNNDGKDEILVRNTTSGALGMWSWNGTETEWKPIGFGVDNTWKVIA